MPQIPSLFNKSSLPGLAVFIFLWVVTRLRFDFISLVEDYYHFLQFLEPKALKSAPLASILNLHTQPPLLNSITALDLIISPRTHLFAALTLLVLVGFALALVVDCLRMMRLSMTVQTLGGVVFAVLPASVVYALFFYNTALVVFGVSVTLWGSIAMRSRPLLGVCVTSIGAALLVLTRPSFVWPAALLWIGWHLFCSVRICGGSAAVMRRLIPVFSAVVVILGVQAHYFVQFGLVGMSSFTGQNIANGLVQSDALFSRGEVRVPESALRRLQDRPCQLSLVASLRDGTAPLWDSDGFRSLPGCSALPSLPARGVRVWDSPIKAAPLESMVNPNSSESLVAGRQWQSAVFYLLVSDPRPLVRMAFISDVLGPSGLVLYLGSAEVYDPVMPIRSAHPLSGIGRVISLPFAPLALILGAVGSLLAWRVRGLRRVPIPSLGPTWVLVGYHVLVSVLGEWGEGMRFQAEITPALLVLLITGAWRLARGPVLTADLQMRGV